ncbi:hypothetical protein KY290_031408 [Solanum tuberosum]|uniref:Uncharacterized protein n=1 Tax=Solanum tuberosum TaxID=4113 RepID=A0ABQ7U978_SOLTU|nr:hypothetical protein KY290_031408 [Solanum tuberosum]
MILPHLDSRLNSLVIGNDYEFVPSLVTGDDREIILSSSGLQLGQSSNMLESQLTPLAIESMTISEDEIM